MPHTYPAHFESRCRLSVALLEGLWVQNRLLSKKREISSVCVALIFSRIDLTTFLGARLSTLDES